MNVIKHMEAAFLFSLAVAGIASVAVGGVEPAQASVSAPAVAENLVGTPDRIAVVKVVGKRMSATEKQQSLALERVRSRA